ncbi:hypothetical protein BC832DRAFT_560360 [Gaertneriomyces semiglobifer]|nr:hypothetical protein BC832DRAFT_560360 [Gaertneriomyces semiglobifer]
MAVLPPITGRQWLYLGFMHCLIPAIISGAINFGIATPMYRDKPIHMFTFPNNLAGDAAVTAFIQTTITFLLDGALTSVDVRKGIAKPIPFYLPRFSIFRLIFPEGQDLDNFGPAPSGRYRLRRLWLTIRSGLVLSLLVILPMWGLGVGIACAVWPEVTSSEGGSGWPEPQVFKAIYAFCLAMITTPVSTIAALSNAARIRDDKEVVATSDRTVALQRV